MSRSKRVLRNLLVLLGLCFLFVTQTVLYLTPLSAYEHSERSLHYGPSTIVHVEDYDGGKYILAKYDRWFSCNGVRRTLGLFWKPSNWSLGTENDKTKAVAFSWSASQEDFVVYGIINDERVKTLEVTLDDGQILTQTKFYDSMFLIPWTGDKYLGKLRGYDAADQVIFEFRLP